MKKIVALGIVAGGLLAIYGISKLIEATTTTTKPPEKNPIIETDKDGYSLGQNIYWTARNLIVGKKYGVGLWIDNTFVNDPTRDNFVANSDVQSGQFYIPNFVPVGYRKFSLFEIVNGKYIEVAFRIIAIAHITL